MNYLMKCLMNLFRKNKLDSSNIHSTTRNNHELIGSSSEDVNDMISPKIRSSFTATKQQLDGLTVVWQKLGSLSEQINADISLWHSGTIGSHDMIDDTNLLWCTRDKNLIKSYQASAKLDAPYLGKDPYLIHFKTKRMLNMADFNLKSLRPYTATYCDQDHRILKKILRVWCLENGFDGAVKTNSSIDEVVLCYPGQDLEIITLTAL